MNSIVKKISGNVITVDFPKGSTGIVQHERLLRRFYSIEKEFSAFMNKAWRNYEIAILRELRIDQNSVVKPDPSYSLASGEARTLNGDFLADFVWMTGSSVINEYHVLDRDGSVNYGFTAENIPFRPQDESVYFLCIPNFSSFDDVVSRLEKLRDDMESAQSKSSSNVRWKSVGLLTNELSENQIEQLENMWFVPVTDLDIEIFMKDKEARNECG